MLKQLFFYIFVSTVYILTSSEKDYGEFSLAVTSFVNCKGPKRKDCCIISAKMENAVNLTYNIQILENVTPSKGKIIAMANDKPLVRLQMKNPCDHLFMGPLIRAMLNVSQNCVFKKGNYTIKINIEDVAQKYYGGSFLYGNLTFRSVFYADTCNFSCAVVEVEIFPKNKTKLT